MTSVRAGITEMLENLFTIPSVESPWRPVFWNSALGVRSEKLPSMADVGAASGVLTTEK
jgi:hypothetical protein